MDTHETASAFAGVVIDLGMRVKLGPTVRVVFFVGKLAPFAPLPEQ
jgi:hypothetical protein